MPVSDLSSHMCTVGSMSEDVPEEPCKDAPVALYAWPWGDKGACCARHQFILNQRAQSLGQAITISPLNVPTAPMTRDERTQMHAQILTLNDEVAELRNRSAELYNDNVKLQTEGRRLLARSNELEDQLQKVSYQSHQIADDRDEMTAQRDDLRAELDRTKLLVAPARNAPPATVTSGQQARDPDPWRGAGG